MPYSKKRRIFPSYDSRFRHSRTEHPIPPQSIPRDEFTLRTVRRTPHARSAAPIRRRAPSSANDIFPVRNRRRHRTPPQPTTVLFRKPLRNPLPEKRGCEKRSDCSVCLKKSLFSLIIFIPLNSVFMMKSHLILRLHRIILIAALFLAASCKEDDTSVQLKAPQTLTAIPSETSLLIEWGGGGRSCRL